MSTTDLTEATFETTISGSDIVLVDFWASWCGPCQQFAPVYDAAAQRHPDIVFAKVDTEAETELARAAGIRSIPTLMAFRERVLVYSQPGALPAAGLEEVIEEVRGLDMSEVHAQINRQRALLDKPREVSPEQFVELHGRGVRIIDVREPYEYETGHVPGAELIPLDTLPRHTEALPREQAVYIICATGNRSLTATDFLRRAGIEAYSVAGGTAAWRGAGHAVV